MAKRKPKADKLDAIEVVESDGMTIKQRLFLDHYIICMNGTQSARLAGYEGDSATLAVIASQNLRNHNVSRALEDRLNNFTMSANEVLARLSDIGRGDIADAMDDNGEIDPIEARKRGKSHLIKRVKHKRKTITTTNEKKNGEHESEILEDEYEVEMYDAQAALTTLLKFHGLLVDRVRNEDWRTDIIALIKDGKITLEQVRNEFGDDIAQEIIVTGGLSGGDAGES